MKKDEKLILVTNDDGIEAGGLKALIEAVKPLGKVVVAAPHEPQSGMSHAITVKHPIRILDKRLKDGVEYYKIQGTPVDCVKLAVNQLLDRKPDLLVSGINHGSNSSTSVLYSGTMAAAIEGSVNEIRSVGFSLITFDEDADFEESILFARNISQKIMSDGLPYNICLNVNIPYVEKGSIKGIKVCRQNSGFWREEFEKRTDPSGRNYYWLTGKFHNTEPDAVDTDEWALKNNYVSVVPIKTDFTCYQTLDIIKNWNI
jgi:5'-nucleotidase